MIFRVTLKDPDGVYDSREDAAKKWANEVKGVEADERESLIDSRRDKMQRAMEKWFEYDEYLTVEIDTEAGTCVVVEAK